MTNKTSVVWPLPTSRALPPSGAARSRGMFPRCSPIPLSPHGHCLLAWNVCLGGSSHKGFFILSSAKITPGKASPTRLSQGRLASSFSYFNFFKECFTHLRVILAHGPCKSPLYCFSFSTRAAKGHTDPLVLCVQKHALLPSLLLSLSMEESPRLSTLPRLKDPV